MIRSGGLAVGPSMIPNIGPMEIMILLAIVLIIFGPKKLPELGRSVGRGIREFKGSLSGEEDDLGKDREEASPPTLEGSSTRV